MKKIRLGIVGYGNLGRGVQYAASQSGDMEVVAVFTRRGSCGRQNRSSRQSGSIRGNEGV